MSTDQLTLNALKDAAATAIAETETALAAAYATLGPNSSPAQLLAFQAQLSINSTVTSIYSALIKERSDTLKSIVQKF